MIREFDRKLETAAEQIEQATNSLSQILTDKQHLSTEEVNDLHEGLLRINHPLELGFDAVEDFARVARAFRMREVADIAADEVPQE